MATDQSAVEYIVEQMSWGLDVRAKKMFGEYGLYCNQVFIGMICNDELFLKITDAGEALLPDAEQASPYDGARPHLLVAAETIEDAERLSELAARTAAALPLPKPKKAKSG